LYERLVGVTSISVIASGGVGTLDHLRRLATLPLDGVIVGKAIYERRFTVEEAIAVLA
jgi:phosphoribosylformimino-5-aminoimidazole carboxamide ribotide isomerase